MHELMKKNGEAILRIAHEHGASNLRLFGSCARGGATDHSDIDILADFEPERSYFDIIRFEREFQELLGRDVDVRIEHELRRIPDRIAQDIVPL